MKNIEKYIDYIAKWVSDYVGCPDCPCYSDCLRDTLNIHNTIGCEKAFKRWALEEANDGQKD